MKNKTWINVSLVALAAIATTGSKVVAKDLVDQALSNKVAKITKKLNEIEPPIFEEETPCAGIDRD